jgi:hypothetical protein
MIQSRRTMAKLKVGKEILPLEKTQAIPHNQYPQTKDATVISTTQDAIYCRLRDDHQSTREG